MKYLSCDEAGHKLTMADPDLGNWSYDYDALGAMKSQTDARGCVTNLDYDLLGRPTGKSYSNCPSTPNVTYIYDSGTNGIGRRTSMGVTGVDFTQWTYDARGRVVSENKQITGGGQFVTSFTYNSADLPVTMTYPVDNEVVTFGYNNNMQIVSVSGSDTYAQSIAYDSAGRTPALHHTCSGGRCQGTQCGASVTQIIRGANKINSVFDYNDWNVDGGRLQNLTSTQVSTEDPLQNLTYDYDSVGNILTIADSLSGPQTQTFQYDELDRLTSSAVTGGTNGIYTEGYTYETGTGNLKSKNGSTYTYDTTHKHAVASLLNGNAYGYDANGNTPALHQTQCGASVTSRHVFENDQFNDYALSYDAENLLVSVSGVAVSAMNSIPGRGQRLRA